MSNSEALCGKQSIITFAPGKVSGTGGAVQMTVATGRPCELLLRALLKYLFLQNLFDFSDLLLDFSGRLFSMAFSFELRVAHHSPGRRFDGALYLVGRTLYFVLCTCAHLFSFCGQSALGHNFC